MKERHAANRGVRAGKKQDRDNYYKNLNYQLKSFKNTHETCISTLNMKNFFLTSKQNECSGKVRARALVRASELEKVNSARFERDQKMNAKNQKHIEFSGKDNDCNIREQQYRSNSDSRKRTLAGKKLEHSSLVDELARTQNDYDSHVTKTVGCFNNYNAKLTVYTKNHNDRENERSFRNKGRQDNYNERDQKKALWESKNNECTGKLNSYNQAISNYQRNSKSRSDSNAADNAEIANQQQIFKDNKCNQINRFTPQYKRNLCDGITAKIQNLQNAINGRESDDADEFASCTVLKRDSDNCNQDKDKHLNDYNKALSKCNSDDDDIRVRFAKLDSDENTEFSALSGAKSEYEGNEAIRKTKESGLNDVKSRHSAKKKECDDMEASNEQQDKHEQDDLSARKSDRDRCKKDLDDLTAIYDTSAKRCKDQEDSYDALSAQHFKEE